MPIQCKLPMLSTLQVGRHCFSIQSAHCQQAERVCADLDATQGTCSKQLPPGMHCCHAVAYSASSAAASSAAQGASSAGLPHAQQLAAPAQQGCLAPSKKCSLQQGGQGCRAAQGARAPRVQGGIRCSPKGCRAASDLPRGCRASPNLPPLASCLPFPGRHVQPRRVVAKQLAAMGGRQQWAAVSDALPSAGGGRQQCAAASGGRVCQAGRGA
mmetsp:Transcript_22528/g.67083  ORF Transcript_22528/g.67083 Transcript_22528/m.67083 type:complete len:213 (-) Transcript_22528:1585-2223(-)